MGDSGRSVVDIAESKDRSVKARTTGANPA